MGEKARAIGAEMFFDLESIEVDENNQWFTSGNGYNAIIDK